MQMPKFLLQTMRLTLITDIYFLYTQSHIEYVWLVIFLKIYQS